MYWTVPDGHGGAIKYREPHCSLTQWTMQLVRWSFLRLKTWMGAEESRPEVRTGGENRHSATAEMIQLPSPWPHSGLLLLILLLLSHPHIKNTHHFIFLHVIKSSLFLIVKKLLFLIFFSLFFLVLFQLLLSFSQLGVYNCCILMKSVGVECISAKSTMALIFSLRQSKREGKRQREREVTLLPEWQWPSCIASLKWGWGGGECHFQVSPQHSSLMRDGFCSTDSQGDQERALPASSSSLSSTSQISNPLRSWQLGDRRACVSSTCTTPFPNHNNNNKGREISASWYSPRPCGTHISLHISLNEKEPHVRFDCILAHFYSLFPFREGHTRILFS